MYTITSFKIDERCLTPGGIGRATGRDLDILSIIPVADRESDLSGDVFIYDGEVKLGYQTVQTILRWGMGEALGHKCNVTLDNKVQMTFDEYWQHGNAYHNYLAMSQEPEYHSEASMLSARRAFERAILVYHAHEVE